jgi:hypothetical protein
MPTGNHWQQVGLYSAPDKRSDLQLAKVFHSLNSDTGSFVQVDVIGLEVADDVEQGNQSAVSFVVNGVSEEHRVSNDQAGLFFNFPVQRLLDGLAVLDGTPEARPAVWVGDSGFVVSVMHEQSAAGDDQQHRRPARWLGFGL